MLHLHEVERALVVTAHPDDVDFGAACTVANLTDAGIAVTYCLVTDGQAGGHDLTVARDDMARIRRAEQVVAAAHVGVTDLLFLGMMDGSVELWVINAEPATDTVDITDQIDRKMSALLSHVSQLADPESMRERMFGWFSNNASLGGLPDGRLAERFTVVNTRRCGRSPHP
jgi:LmbE family N-acetylglucosaminyl deacetylase